MGFALIALLAATQKPQPAPISIQLSATKKVYKSGEEVIFVATTQNLTKQAIELVSETDSMNWGRKAPYLYLEAKLPDGTWDKLVMKNVGRCGNANPIKAEDFVTVQPGQSVDLLNGMQWSKYEVQQCLLNPGTYQIHLRYDTTPKFGHWMGGPLIPEEEQRLSHLLQPHYERTPKGVFVSNEVTIRVQ